MADMVCIRERDYTYKEHFSQSWNDFEDENLWVDKEKLETYNFPRIMHATSHTYNTEKDVDEIEKKFLKLADLWRQGTRFTSSTTEIVMHMAYQQIIGMGPVVIPLILRELAKRPGHWFWALHAITGIDPTTSEQRGRLKEMSDAWVRWGEERGYVRDVDK